MIEATTMTKRLHYTVEDVIDHLSDDDDYDDPDEPMMEESDDEFSDLEQITQWISTHLQVQQHYLVAPPLVVHNLVAQPLVVQHPIVLSALQGLPHTTNLLVIHHQALQVHQVMHYSKHLTQIMLKLCLGLGLGNSTFDLHTQCTPLKCDDLCQ